MADDQQDVSDGDIPLSTLIARHLAARRALHEDGERAGIECEFCERERQFPGKSFYMTVKGDDRDDQ